MAGRKPYSPAYKAKLVKRMQGPNGISACRLAKETSISQQTLSRWRLEADNLPVMAQRQSGKRRWTVEEKVRVLSETTGISAQEVGAYLRREGVHPSELEAWRSALESDTRVDLSTKRRIGALERELRRKEKALAEAAALLVLKKKVEAYPVDEDDDTDESSGSES